MTAAPGQKAPYEISAPEVWARSPLLSILTITYNHAAFITECLASAMRQHTTFPTEMVIGEDCSTDGTRAICEEYQRRHPDRIRLLLPPVNRGRYENFRQAFAACRGRYVALLEGDDYWTVPDKLQRQVDLLEAHPEWALSFHNVCILEDNRPTRLFFETRPKAVFTQEDFIERNFVPTCACVFRNQRGVSFPAWYYDEDKNPYPDWVLHVLTTARGAAGYIHAVMAVHRRHAGGVWGRTFSGGLDAEIERMTRRLKTFARLAECMPPQCQQRLRRQRALAAFHLAVAWREKGHRTRACQYALRALREDPRAGLPWARFLLRTALGRNQAAGTEKNRLRAEGEQRDQG